MADLTKTQAAIHNFIAAELASGRPCPSHREIASHFAFASSYAAACHVRALLKKGVLVVEAGKARSLQLASNFKQLRRTVLAQIPVFGSIPAGFADERKQEAKGCVSIDIQSLGFKPSSVAFALEVRGDSMIGKLIAPGDLVVIEPRADPKAGDVVAALIDGESTLKTFMTRGGKPYLRAENPRYPDLIPATELVIQGVVVFLFRKRK